MNLNKTIKVIFWGDGGVGKTSIIKRFLYNIFDSISTKSTYGLEVFTKVILINGNKVSIAFWDFGGQPQFRSVVKMLARGIDIFVFVFDLSDPDAFSPERIDPLIKAIGPALNDSVPKILVGSKTDLPAEVTDNEIFNFMAQYKFDDYFEVSARDGNNIRILFDRIFWYATDIVLRNFSSHSKNKARAKNKL
ncbi:MAG: Rab family GTPase [Candidatus Asgardarchaeia archaeon]